ncbi:hypothetical protein AVEN_254189-1 [Araneus ventricosus]|uniref:Uncharacterized protein n=1 Tax=Araneus ventricosus TaxID=182803 RepID=A0A4Y2RNZ5_ARAVE|nr:hypothetical protein AVEN_254189-1 [Araneus ventricosus]
MIVLGKAPARIHWRPPGAIHHARWIAKLIYGIKIYLFRNQKDVFKLTKKEDYEERFVKFGALLYTKAWNEAPLSTEALANDLQLWKDLKKIRVRNFEISKTSRDVFERHLWYLSDELVELAIFSDNIISEKKQTVSNLTIKSEKSE